MVAAPAIVPTATFAVGAQLVACGAGNDPATGVVRGAAVKRIVALDGMLDCPMTIEAKFILRCNEPIRRDTK